MRLFVALPVPPAVRTVLAGAVAPLRDGHPRLRFTDPAGWHLTLAFIGRVEALGPVVDAVAPVARMHTPVRLAVGSAGRFGTQVLHVHLDAEPAPVLGELAADVQAALIDAGIEVERRPLRAHLTLARANEEKVSGAAVTALDAALGRVREQLDAAAVGWRSERIEVWRSHLGDGPARYEVVGSLPASA
jgi:RNA 2',3'-cyclic 3'-phosphodiesterase